MEWVKVYDLVDDSDHVEQVQQATLETEQWVSSLNRLCSDPRHGGARWSVESLKAIG